MQRARSEGGRQPDGFLWTEIMGENWPLFAARISGRSPTENEARLLEASHRLWPSALASVKSKLSESPALQAEARSLTTEVWEETLSSVLRTMDKLGHARISDLDSYVFAIFTHRLNRHLAKERKRRRIVEFVPGTEELAELKGAQDTSWLKRIESGVLLRQALAGTDEFFRAIAWRRCQGYSWAEIGRVSGLTGEQTRKRFEYGVQKLRKLLRESSGEKGNPE